MADRRLPPRGLPGMEAEEARAAVVAALRAKASYLARSLPARRAALPALGSPRGAADLASVVLRHGRARGQRSRPFATVASRSIPSALNQVYLDWMENIRPGASRASCGGVTSCRCGIAATRPTSAEEPPATRAGSATPTSSTRGSRPRRGPSHPRLAGHPDLHAFYPTDVLSTARDILFLWVAG